MRVQTPDGASDLDHSRREYVSADSDLDVPADWARAASLVADGDMRRVLVIGPRDVGKSSLNRVLVGAAAEHRETALLDADLGPKTVGPPACVTLGRFVGEQLALSALAFVGTTDPLHGWSRMIDGLRRLSAEAHADVLVVNTGGLLSGPGLELKLAKMEVLTPDLVIAIGDHPALEILSHAHPSLPFLRLAPSRRARRKSRGERRRAPLEAFRRYFAEARTWTASTSELMPPSLAETASALPSGLLVGVRDRAARDRGLGIVIRANPASDAFALLTPVPEGGAVRLHPGKLILDCDYNEKRIELDQAIRRAASCAVVGQRPGAGFPN